MSGAGGSSGASASNGVAGFGVAGGAATAGGAGLSGTGASAGFSSSGAAGTSFAGNAGNASGGAAGSSFGGAAGTGNASGSAGDAGASSCAAGDVRCNVKRERCGMDGLWHTEDFVCAVDIDGSDEESMGCAVKSDGSLACWTSALYQAGWYLDAVKNAPKRNWARVFVADDPAGVYTNNSVCAIDVNGHAACWGGTGIGFEGDGVSGMAPGSCGVCLLDSKGGLNCPVTPCGSISAIGTGPFTQIQMRSGQLYSLTASGQPLAPYRMPPSGVYTQISANNDEMCAVRDDGQLYCEPSAAPQALLDGKVSQVAVEYSGVICVIRADRTLACSDASFAPPEGEFTRIATVLEGMCAIRIDGTIACWGPFAVTLPAGW